MVVLNFSHYKMKKRYMRRVGSWHVVLNEIFTHSLYFFIVLVRAVGHEREREGERDKLTAVKRGIEI